MLRLSISGFIAAVLGAFALGYAVRLTLGEYRPMPRVVPDVAPGEWVPGEYAGFPNAYHVRPLD